MSNYKVGDVAALFSKPKEPTTEAGKKLQSLFQQFHSKNKSTYQSQETSPKKNKSKTENEEHCEQKVSKKNKKRKFSAAFDQESSANEEHKKMKITVNQEVELKSKKKKYFSEDRDFPRKKKKASKLNSFDSTFSNSKMDESFVNDTKPADISPAGSPKGKKVKSGFIKKSKHIIYDANDSHCSENEMKLTNASKSNNNPKGKKVKSGFIKKSKHIMYDANDSNCSENEIKLTNASKLNNNPKGKKVKSGFTKKSKNQTYDANDSFDKSQIKKSRVNSEAFDSKDESFKEEIKEFIQSNFKKSKKKNHNNASSQKTSDEDSSLFVQNSVNKHFSETSSSFENGPKNKSQTSDFIRRPKNRNKANAEEYDNEDSSNKKAFDNGDDILFKSENEDYVKHGKKKYIKNFTNNNSPRKSSFKNEPEFTKLLEKIPEDKDELSRTLFVGNLPVTTRLNELKHLFSPFGEIDYIRFKGVETDKAKIFGENAPKSLNANYAANSVPGFIVFKERESAASALKLCGTVFKNHHITVDFSMPAGNSKLYDEKRSIFIGNLPFDVTDENIWDAFLDCGKIEGVRVVRDKTTGIGKGFGYVLFSASKSREKALSLEDLKIGGRSIRITAVDSKKNQRNSGTAVAKRDTFKSRAIAFRNKNKNSRKSLTKLMKKEKALHKKKKISSLLQKSMK